MFQKCGEIFGFVIRNEEIVELGPSSDAVKALSNLENLMNEKGYTSCKHAVEMSLGLIRLTENSMHNAHKIYLKLAKLLYPEVRFIQSIHSASC